MDTDEKQKKIQNQELCLQRLEEMLQAAGNPSKQRSICKTSLELIPEQVAGVPMGVLRRLARDLDGDTQEALLEGKHRLYEEDLLMVLLLHAMKDPAKAWHVLQARKDCFYSWSLTDACWMPHIPDDLRKEWAVQLLQDENPYMQRLAIVWAIKHWVKDPENLPMARKALQAPSKEVCVQMAKAWLLCEGMIHQPVVFADWIVQEPDLKVQKMAISKCRDSFRISQETVEMLKTHCAEKRTDAMEPVL